MSRVTFRASAFAFLLSTALTAACSSSPDEPDPVVAPSNDNPLTPSGQIENAAGAGGTSSLAPAATNPGSNDEGTPVAMLAPALQPMPAAPVSGEPGLLVAGGCYAPCGFASVTDPDGDGYGRERQATCINPDAPLAAGAMSCVVPPPALTFAPGNGVFTGQGCQPLCSSALTDRDAAGVSDGYGYEHERTCVVSGTATSLGGLSCDPMLPPLPSGDGISVAGECRALCRNAAGADPDGYGFENNLACVVSASRAALQGLPCEVADAPPPPPPPPPPPGNGWNADYTATMFGEINCQPFGFDDPGNSNLNQATCVGRRAVQLNAQNQTYFGAVGDLSTLWTGGQCTCNGGQANADRCNSAPGCGGQTNCGQCVEVACNGTGTHSFMGDGYTHNEFCRPGRSVVVQLIDACPHNHPNNPYWCTRARPNHIDISCSAFSELAEGRPLGEIGSINVYARPVPCPATLGPRTF